MQIFILVLIILAIYFFIVFVGLRLVVPFMGFKMYKAPASISPEISKAILELETKSIDQQTYLQEVYKSVLNKNINQWQHSRFQAAFRIPQLFVKDLNYIWHTKDFVYCTAINYVVFVLLINSKYFKPEEVIFKHVFLNFVIHQYLQVKVLGKWVDVDPAGAGIRGGAIGTHAEFFG